MINSFMPPKPGERIALLCTKCKAMFFGPNPDYDSPFRFLYTPVKKTRCPKCGSTKVILHPAVDY